MGSLPFLRSTPTSVSGPTGEHCDEQPLKVRHNTEAVLSPLNNLVSLRILPDHYSRHTMSALRTASDINSGIAAALQPAAFRKFGIGLPLTLLRY